MNDPGGGLPLLKLDIGELVGMVFTRCRVSSKEAWRYCPDTLSAFGRNTAVCNSD